MLTISNLNILGQYLCAARIRVALSFDWMVRQILRSGQEHTPQKPASQVTSNSETVL